MRNSLIRLAFVSVAVAASASPANATPACTDVAVAPDDAFASAGCNGVCTEGAGTWDCDLTVLGCGAVGAEAFITNTTGSLQTHPVVAWGQCVGGANPFYCCVGPGGTIWTTNVTSVSLIGTPEDDELAFTFLLPGGGTATTDLQPWDLDAITGTILADDGIDVIDGSTYTGADYGESLFGEGDADTILGNGGDDLIVGGNGADVLEGGDGNDTLQGDGGTDILRGNEGDDDLFGGADADTLCDSVGVAVCATAGAQRMSSAGGNDIIWYTDDPLGACAGREMDPLSDAGAGTDWFGKDSHWGLAEEPANVENRGNGIPPNCP